MDNMSLSDIAAVTRDKDNLADGGIWGSYSFARPWRRIVEP